ncbi:ABC transporter ATP-binding protein [Rathayibacter iranicus]|uniref:ATP-binding cassette subfamily B protein/ATP-binding cassette subfamily C protein n=1 Tax=Rathayibacter iranicus NCPPB 2253 = VKM Ac-1602 TaxID=1328868 RepID=A0ABX5LCI0_9MICO|nr:ABC transporter ATP-binding protein [Rathayibacter iranicus]MWV32233.1 ATP-binding cassette domain-containing protein [Rathayibacter iranicus NCPPB 2253 = VKM Ac-1602]PWJ61541.1 ATP-binding cassette subfamily B protein/ATP-binding cassette subfamily C protein [Rathayibacter iranicus NCPPB 2253 = VKM Ac-1602]
MTILNGKEKVRELREPRSPGMLLILQAAKIAPWPTAVLALLMGIAALLPLSLAVFSGKLIGLLANSEGTALGIGRGLFLTILTIGFFFFLQQALTPLLLGTAEILGRKVDRALRIRVLDSLAAPETMAGIEAADIRNLLGGINGGLGSAKIVDALTGLVNITVVRWGALAGLLLFIPYRWWVAPLAAAAYVVAMSLGSRVYQIGLKSSEGDPSSGVRSRYLQALVATPAAAKDVRIFGLTDWLRATRNIEWLRGIKEDRSARSGVRSVSVISGVLVFVVQASLLLMLYSDFRAGLLSEDTFTSLLVVVVGLGTALSLSSEMVSVSTGGAKIWAVRQLEASLKTGAPRAGKANEPSQASDRQRPRKTPSILFEDVWFTYPGSMCPVLRGLSFEMGAGVSTALVGVNGAGKSTVVKLMAGFYRPDSGRILIDGVDVADMDRSEWQRQCAILSQTWIRWGLSIRENVLWGAPGAAADEAVLSAVSLASGLADIVAHLPQGWETPLSRGFGGTDLSGGQWQRVALARALYAQASGARLLIMDEPTSALDVGGEAEINANLMNAASDDTLLLVSHRFAGVRQAKHIVVLENGQVTEQGKHKTLMERDGLYAQMFRTQAERYIDDGQAHDN